ncbi:MAG: sigma-70 family RNA polymerase sigma factor, partial [Gemmatimonadetes bacterium]|nr:sigma-70 family RNA polymerase sigma factor [Gemmatimonadota bacterium]
SDEDAAEDLLQETYLRIQKNLDRLEDEDRIVSWVYRIARNLIHDHYRTGGRTDYVAPADLERLESATGGRSGSDEDADANRNDEVMSWLPATIEGLPVKYRQAVRMFELERRPQKEIADTLGISLTAAKSRVRRGRAMLVDWLHECCAFELDAHGNVLDYHVRKREDDCDCDEQG